MNTKIIPMLVLVAGTTVLSAQITREKADMIVKDYLQGKSVEYSTLYANVNTPSEEGIIIMASNDKAFKAKYACWAYYLNENELSRCHYFFVKTDNGNLLEVIANNDTGQSDSTQWKAVNSVSIIEWGKSDIPPYPNPVDDVLNIPVGEHTHIEIHDLKGICVFSDAVLGKEVYQLNVSFLKAGVYLLSIYGETRVVYKIIKN